MINAIVDKVVALIDTALPLYKKVDGVYTPVKNIDAGKHPHAMVYDPTVVSVPLRDGQREQTMTLLCMLIRAIDEATEMRDDLDVVVAALDDDPTLTTSVDKARAESWVSFESQAAHTTGGMVIEIKVVD